MCGESLSGGGAQQKKRMSQLGWHAACKASEYSLHSDSLEGNDTAL